MRDVEKQSREKGRPGSREERGGVGAGVEVETLSFRL